jgi:hypothetical protein
MEVTGILIAILPEQSGQTEKGTWVKGGFVIETEGEYPKKIAFTLFGEEKLNKIKEFSVGQILNVQFSAQSREWQGRWFTELNCFRVEPSVTQPAYSQQPMQPAYPQQPVYNQPIQQPVYQPQMTQPYQQPQPQAYQPTQEVLQKEYGDNGSNDSDDLPF